MNYAEIKKVDIANGPGVRVSLFVSGCTHHCKGCFNEVTWDFNYGNPFSVEVEDEIIAALRPYYIRGLTLLGGEPLEPVNQAALLHFVRRVRAELPEKDIWCYTGYVFDKEIMGGMWETVMETKELIPMFDVVVDGPFVEAQKNISLKFRGSSNQRIIDVKKTLSSGNVVLYEEAYT